MEREKEEKGKTNWILATTVAPFPLSLSLSLAISPFLFLCLAGRTGSPPSRPTSRRAINSFVSAFLRASLSDSLSHFLPSLSLLSLLFDIGVGNVYCFIVSGRYRFDLEIKTGRVTPASHPFSVVRPVAPSCSLLVLFLSFLPLLPALRLLSASFFHFIQTRMSLSATALRGVFQGYESSYTRLRDSASRRIASHAKLFRARDSTEC